MKQKKTTQHEVDIEGLGVFYLGRKVDPDTGKPGTDAAEKIFDRDSKTGRRR